jgi:hypothetical protein
MATLFQKIQTNRGNCHFPPKSSTIFGGRLWPDLKNGWLIFGDAQSIWALLVRIFCTINFVILALENKRPVDQGADNKTTVSHN